MKKNGRKVNKDTVISTLYNHGNEATHVIVDLKGSNPPYEFRAEDSIDKIKGLLDDIDFKEETYYVETLLEITTKEGGETYYTADDGTKIIITPGEPRTYIIYTKKI